MRKPVQDDELDKARSEEWIRKVNSFIETDGGGLVDLANVDMAHYRRSQMVSSLQRMQRLAVLARWEWEMSGWTWLEAPRPPLRHPLRPHRALLLPLQPRTHEATLGRALRHRLGSLCFPIPSRVKSGGGWTGLGWQVRSKTGLALGGMVGSGLGTVCAMSVLLYADFPWISFVAIMPFLVVGSAALRLPNGRFGLVVWQRSGWTTCS